MAEVLDAEQNLFGKRVRPVEDWLKRYLKSGFILRYERRKEIASDETIGTQTVQPFVLTPTLVGVVYPYITMTMYFLSLYFLPVVCHVGQFSLTGHKR